jgi:hypothetical protein
VEPYEYLVGKLVQVEVALEDFEAVAEVTPYDQEHLAKLEQLKARLVATLAMLELDASRAGR